MKREAAVAVVGLGNLGLAIATGLHRHGFSVRGHDSDGARVELAGSRGLTTIAADEVGDCSVILFVVPDEVAIWAMLHEQGLLRRLTEQHLVICHSTVLPTRVQQLATDIESAGARFVEVPVSGGPERAERGELTLFVAGFPDAVEEARPLLEAEGSHLVEVGPVGAGAATKLANQLVMFSAHAALLEGLRLAASYGVAEGTVLAALETATGDTWVGRNWGFFDRVAADYDAAGVPLSSRPWSKDTAEILAAGKERDLSLPLAHLIHASVPAAIEDHAAAARDGSGP